MGYECPARRASGWRAMPRGVRRRCPRGRTGAAVEAWERERYTAIRQQARKADARIDFADEAGACGSTGFGAERHASDDGIREEPHYLCAGLPVKT